MKEHDLIWKPKLWVGEGVITLNMLEEKLSFFIKWNILPKDREGRIRATQEIQLIGLSEKMQNELTFFDFSDTSFSVELENVSFGTVIGKGLYRDRIIAWEFRANEMGFEGLEKYILQEDGSYLMQAEYMTSDQFRTEIQGRLTKKEP